jgi:L-threonylcarbamoyladenylate synthase
VGIESTIVDLSGARPRILRPGQVTREQLVAVLGEVEAGAGSDSPRASGTLEAHYAPRTPMLLLAREGMEREAAQQRALGQNVGLLALGALPAGFAGVALPAEAQGYAHGLYAALRALDAGGAHLLLVQRPPEGREWLAVNDRLRRAAAGAAPAFDSP